MTGPTDRSSNAGPRGLSAGPILLAIGAAALLVSLFLNWFKPELTAWTAFEIVDLLLALIALAAFVPGDVIKAVVATLIAASVHRAYPVPPAGHRVSAAGPRS